MSYPKISVCIPTYNYGRYIAQALNSVLCQSFTDFEILIADDASSDATDEILAGYVARDARIRYIRHESNLGMVENWNFCLREARGTYIKYLFADDYFTSPLILEQMASALDSDETIALVGSARKFVNSTTGVAETVSLSSRTEALDGRRVINGCLLSQQNGIGEPTAVMFRKQQAGRGFDCRYRQLVDLEMWFYLLEQGRYYHLAEPLCAFRVHAEQQSAVTAREHVIAKDLVLLYTDYLCKPYITIGPVLKEYLHYDCFYKVWKLYARHRLITFAEFLARVGSYGPARFFALYPAYKVGKPFFRQYRKRYGFS